MNNLIRLILFYLVPVSVGLCLHLLTSPMTIEISKLAGGIIQSAKGPDGFDAVVFMRELDDPEYVRTQRILDWSQVAYVVLSLAIGALLVSQKLRYKQIADVITAITLGILTSKIVFGYPLLSWKELWVWIAAGVLSFALVFALRLWRNS